MLGMDGRFYAIGALTRIGRLSGATLTTDGLRLPAEWEPHAATAFTWPRNPQTWHQGLTAPRRALGEAVVALARDETVHIHFDDDATRVAELARLGCDAQSVVGHLIRSNDAWCRDHGALIAKHSDGRRVALDFGFNAWGGKYPPWDLDAQVAQKMAGYLDLEHMAQPFVLEGGAIDVNGQGLVMTTASCVLNSNRNQGVQRSDIEQRFARTFGTAQVLWLQGDIAGDDTDGHIDNLARFVGPARVLVVAPESPRGTAQLALANNVELLATQARDGGHVLDIERLPLPTTFLTATSLPASYANFYIGQRSVLMPIYGDPCDDRACAIVAACFADRELVPIDCRDLIVGHGALHCLTQQVPA